MKTALLLLDLQNEMVSSDGAIGKNGLAKVVADRRVIENAASALKYARTSGHAVVHVRLGFRSDYADALSRAPRIEKLKTEKACIASTWGCEFPDVLEPAAGELVVTKQCVNPFYNTILAAWLARHGVETLVIGGVVTNLVVEMTARVADDAGFRVRVLEDCCAAPNPTWHEFSTGSILPMFGEVTSTANYTTGK